MSDVKNVVTTAALSTVCGTAAGFAGGPVLAAVVGFVTGCAGLASGRARRDPGQAQTLIQYLTGSHQPDVFTGPPAEGDSPA